MPPLFRNDSPGALTLDQAVEIEKKRLAERRRQAKLQREQAAQQAVQQDDDFTIRPGGILGGFNPRRNREYLASLGRGEDTEIVHVARGELVVPAELQTHAAAVRNMPLERLRVGSARNSINPYTGAPEFAGEPYVYDGAPVDEITVEKSLLTDDGPTNQNIANLHPSIRYDAARFINAVKDETGQQLRIPEPGGRRSVEAQNDLFTSGRGVTPLPGGKSYHNYGLAFDVAPLNPDGKTANWDIDLAPFAPTAKEYGFEWGGNFTSTPDRPHFQRTYGYTTDQLQQMTAPGALYPTIPGLKSR